MGQAGPGRTLRTGWYVRTATAPVGSGSTASVLGSRMIHARNAMVRAISLWVCLMTNKYERPKSLPSNTRKISTGCGNIYVTVCNAEDKMPVEIFATLGKAGGCATCMLEGLTRAITLGLKYGIPIQEYVEELRNIKCPSTGLDDGVPIQSCPDAISKVLETS